MNDVSFMKPLAPLVLPAVYDDVLSYEEWLSKVIARLNEINELVNSTIGDIDALVDTMVNTKTTALQNQINALKTSLASLQGQIDDIDGDISDALSEAKSYADAQIKKAINGLGNIDAKISAAMKQAENNSNYYTDAKIATLDTRINTIRSNVSVELNAKLAVINTRIDNIIREYPLLYNPTTGFNEDMQTLIYNLYKNLRTLGIMAMKYDDTELTAEAYDDMNLKAIDYDTQMFAILFNDLREMFNPFTGKLSSLRDVVGDLVRRLQWNSKTAEQTDNYDFTTQQIDETTFNAYEQDTNQYLTETDPDLKNKAYRSWLFLGGGTSVVVPEIMITDNSQFAVLNGDGDITFIDTVGGTYDSITIVYNSGTYTIECVDPIRVYSVTRVYDISQLDN